MALRVATAAVLGVLAAGCQPAGPGSASAATATATAVSTATLAGTASGSGSGSTSASGSTGSGSSSGTPTSGASTGTGASSGALTFDGFCAAAPVAYCQVLVGCQLLGAGQCATTPAVTEVGCGPENQLKVDAGILDFLAGPAQACLESLEGGACDATTLLGLNTRCLPAAYLQGNVALGGACDQPADCQAVDAGPIGPAEQGITCDIPGASAVCAGTCSLGFHLGEACAEDGSGPRCGPGQGACTFFPTVPDGGTRGYFFCEPYAAEGSACLTGTGCDPTQAYCADAGAAGYLCQPFRVGAACALAACQDPFQCPCPPGELCLANLQVGDGGAGTCGPLTPHTPCSPAAAGACGPASACLSFPLLDGGPANVCATASGTLGEACDGVARCSPELTCSGADQGVCVAPGGLGDTCFVEVPNSCAAELACANANPGLPGTCIAVEGIGTDCVNSDCDAQLACEPLIDGGAICLPAAGMGQPCDFTHFEPCGNGYCHRPADGGTEGACTPFIPSGQPCDYGMFADQCDNGGACYFVPADGGAICGNAICDD